MSFKLPNMENFTYHSSVWEALRAYNKTQKDEGRSVTVKSAKTAWQALSVLSSIANYSNTDKDAKPWILAVNLLSSQWLNSQPFPFKINNLCTFATGFLHNPPCISLCQNRPCFIHTIHVISWEHLICLLGWITNTHAQLNRNTYMYAHTLFQSYCTVWAWNIDLFGVRCFCNVSSVLMSVMDHGIQPLALTSAKPQYISTVAVTQSPICMILHINNEKKTSWKCRPHSSSCVPGSVLRRVQAGHSPARPDWDSPWFRSPRTLSWTCSSTESLTYSNIHSVTRGHRGEETEGTAVQLGSIKSQRKTAIRIDTTKNVKDRRKHSKDRASITILLWNSKKFN